MCNGTDRYHYSDREGRGTYLCRKCGGGDGFTLLMRYHGWDFKRAADEVREVLGVAGGKRNSSEPPQRAVRETAVFREPDSKRAPTYPKALQIWQAATWEDEYTASHPYAIRKRIHHAAGAARGTATGKLIGRNADCVVVPMRTLEGELTGVECINVDGVKQTFGNKGLLILGNDLDSALPQLVVEGWATAVAILKLYHWNACIYAGFGKGMLPRIARQVAGKYPQRRVVIAGEQDA